MRIASQMPRLVAAGSLAACTLLFSSALAAKAPVLQPDRLIVLSTTDVKGKVNPCGCSTPKGGLARRASYIDSVKTTYGQVLVVDNGGFFPDESGDTYKELASFFVDAMKTLNIDAVNIAERDLKYGRAFLESRVQQSRLPVVNANLIDKKTQRPLFQPYLVKKIGGINVGIMGIITDKGELGPDKDALAVADPLATVQKLVPEMRKKGAQVVVLLSQMGKTETEDLVSNVEGVDVALPGRNVLVVQKGRLIKNTVVCYGGEQGQYACRTEVTLDSKGHMASGDAETVMLGPAVGDKPAIVSLVKSFEDGFNQKLRALEPAKPATPDATKQVTAPPATESAPVKSEGS